MPFEQSRTPFPDDAAWDNDARGIAYGNIERQFAAADMSHLPPFAVQPHEPITAVPWSMPETEKSISCNRTEEDQIIWNQRSDRDNRGVYNQSDDPTWMNEYFRPRFLKPKWADSAYPDVFKEREAQTKAALRSIRKETASKRQARSASKEQLRQAHIKRINNISEADV